MTKRNYYQILNLERNATKDLIIKAYKKMALLYHPDKNNNHEKNFLLIKEAYDVLSDDLQRARYDNLLEENLDINQTLDLMRVFFVSNIKKYNPILANLLNDFYSLV